jgi:hypothetical protein
MTPEFERMLQWGGSPQATCSCGRVHYTNSGDFMEPGELAELETKRAADKDGYIPDFENDAVSIATFNGVSHVLGCKCGSLERIETFLWNHRQPFIEYYQKRTARELKEATANALALEGMSLNCNHPRA